ncbi:MAG: glycosyltransferase family 39 protein, partial [Planctomycetota bacterium]
MADETEIGTKKVEAVAGLAPRGAEELRKDLIAASGVFLFSFALYLLPAVCHRPLSRTPENSVAVVAREMLRSDDYMAPQLERGEHFNKPPLPYWLAAGAARVLGHGGEPDSEVLTRATLLPPALLAALALFMVVLYGSVVFGRPAGLMAGLMLGFSLLVCRFGQTNSTAMPLMFACAGLCCGGAWLVTAPRPGLVATIALGSSLGLGILAGACIPVLLLAGPVLLEVLLRLRFNGRKVGLFLAALAVAAAIAGPWFVAAAPQDWAALLPWLLNATASGGEAQSGHWYFYFLWLAGALFPWTVLLVAAWPLSVGRCLSSERDVSGAGVLAHKQVRFLVLFFGLGFLVLFALPERGEQYLLPLLPALALASGYVLSHFKAPGGVAEERLAWTQLALGLICGIAIILLPLWCPEASGLSGPLGGGLALFNQPLGWALSVPLGLAFFALFFYCARQCVEAKLPAAAMAIAICTYLALGAWSWAAAKWTDQTPALRN